MAALKLLRIQIKRMPPDVQRSRLTLGLGSTAALLLLRPARGLVTMRFWQSRLGFGIRLQISCNLANAWSGRKGGSSQSNQRQLESVTE